MKARKTPCSNAPCSHLDSSAQAPVMGTERIVPLSDRSTAVDESAARNKQEQTATAFRPLNLARADADHGHAVRALRCACGRKAGAASRRMARQEENARAQFVP